MALIAAATAGLGQAGFAPIVMAFLPRFHGSIQLFDTLALTILLLPIATVPSLTLNSRKVNLQTRHLAIWLVALLVNIVANVLVLRAGWGAQAIAVNDVWVQFLVVVVIFETAAPHIWGQDRWRRAVLYGKMVCIIVVAAVVTLVLDKGAEGLHPGHLDIASILLRCGITGAIWAGVAALLLLPREGAGRA